MEAELTTYVQEDPVDIKDIDFNMLLEIDLALLKEVIKAARRAHTEHLKLTIYLKEVGAKKLSVVLFALGGLWSRVQKCCHEVVVDEDGAHRARRHRRHRAPRRPRRAHARLPRRLPHRQDRRLRQAPAVPHARPRWEPARRCLEYKLGGATDEASRIASSWRPSTKRTPPQTAYLAILSATR